jgi:hypothetical protein
MRDHYDFSTGVRGKYAGKVDTSDIRVFNSARMPEPASCRDLDGEIRRKRGDTLVGTLRKTYGPAFAPGVRSDMRLDTLRNRAGSQSLSKLLSVGLLKTQ